MQFGHDIPLPLSTSYSQILHLEAKTPSPNMCRIWQSRERRGKGRSVIQTEDGGKSSRLESIERSAWPGDCAVHVCVCLGVCVCVSMCVSLSVPLCQCVCVCCVSVYACVCLHGLLHRLHVCGCVCLCLHGLFICVCVRK